MPQAQTVQIPKRLPLILGPENRGDSTSFDAKLVNGYIETKKGPEGTEHWICERPGMDEHSRPPAGNATGRGIWNWRGNVYSIFGDTVYKDGVAVAGTVDTTNGVYRFDQVLGSTPKLVLGNGVKAYRYDSGGGLVLISDGDFPAAFRKGWAYLNGTLYVFTATAHVLGSDINDPSSWNPLNDILAQIEPDQGVALNKQLNFVVALKEWTGEIFHDAGNSTGSPLARVESAKINWGCVNQDSMREIDGMLLWLGKTKHGTPEVILLDSLKADSVSTKAVERLLGSADFSTETVYSWVLKLEGHRFYVLTCKTANLTLALDLDERGSGTGGWSQWTDVNGNYLPIVASTTDAQLRTLLQHESNGRIYIADVAYADDDGSLITVDLYTPNFDGGTRRGKNMKIMKIVADQQVGSELLVRVNDHDFDPKKWTNFRRLDLGKRNPMLTDCGTFVRRIHNFRHRSPVRMPRIQAVEMQIDICSL